MSLRGNAVLVNWGGIVKSKEIDYNSWHSLEHMPERISLTGFLRGFRGVGIKGTLDNHKYFMMYEAEDKKVFESKEYLDRLNNPTKWTKDILSNYVSPSRTICDVIASKSLGFAGFVTTIRFLDEEIKKKIDIDSIKNQISKITNMHGITGMHILLGDLKFGQLETEEKKIRSQQGDSDEVISLAILIEGLNIDSLKNAIKKLTTCFSLCEGKLLIINYYKCQHILSKSDLDASK